MTNAQLVSHLSSSTPLTIVLTKTIDFTGTEGTTTTTGCAPWGTAAGCQLAINANNWCMNYERTAPQMQVTYDNAGRNPINVSSNKSLVGSGSSGVIKGKGLLLANGVSNVIIQNIAITGINPKYVWGGDAITLDGTNKIWIDHVTTSLFGRQHIVSGYNANTAVTISNCEINGITNWSATCDGHHYWALYFTGQNDRITLQNDYIHHTSGRSPKLDDGVLVHALNNYWYADSGHAFETAEGAAYALVEASVFQNVVSPLDAQWDGHLFAATSAVAVCQNTLGRSCQAKIFGSSGSLSGSDQSVLGLFKGLPVASAAAATTAQQWVPAHAGVGKL